MPSDRKMPETEAEKIALREALTNGERYRISLDVVVTVLDRDAVRAEVRHRLESARFDSEDGRREREEAVADNFSEALQFIVDAEGIFAGQEALHVRSANVRVEPYDT